MEVEQFCPENFGIDNFENEPNTEKSMNILEQLKPRLSEFLKRAAKPPKVQLFCLLYQIAVKTAKPIGPTNFCSNSHGLRKGLWPVIFEEF